ncbi:MAG: transcription elongation factor GreA [Acidobacteriota bacterium]|nr:MAG: transcription elongation factor GreA [Acidobacteriota bacterium]
MRRIQEKVEQELQSLERELRYDLPREIERATSLGDLRENAEYHAALERQSYVRARIAQLKKRLSQLSTVRLNQIPHDRAAFGSVVTVRDLDGEEQQTYEIVVADDGDPAHGRISLTSPLGKALVSRQVGDEVIVRTPGGERVLEIVELITIHDRAFDAEESEASGQEVDE